MRIRVDSRSGNASRMLWIDLKLPTVVLAYTMHVMSPVSVLWHTSPILLLSPARTPKWVM